MCLTSLLQLAPLTSAAVKLTMRTRPQRHDESCHLHRHANNYTNASFPTKFSTFARIYVALLACISLQKEEPTFRKVGFY